MRIFYKNYVGDKAYLCDFCGKKISSKYKINLKYQYGCYDHTRGIADLCLKCFEDKILINAQMKEKFEMFKKYEVNND